MNKKVLVISTTLAALLLLAGSCVTAEKNLVAELEKLAASTDGSLFLVAHRGNTYEGIVQGVPENSIGAIEKSIAAGADMIEIDVRTTSDGEFVLMHDVTVNRTTNGRGPVARMTLAEIRALRQKALNGTQTNSVVPTLEEALIAGRDKVFFDLDVAGKHNDLAKMARLVKSLGMIDQVMFWISNDMDDVRSIQSVDMHCIIFPGAPSTDEVEYWSSNERVKVVHLSGTEGTRHIVDRATAKGMASLFNTLGEADEALVGGDRSGLDKIVSIGGKVIQTDVIEKVREALATP